MKNIATVFLVCLMVTAITGADVVFMKDGTTYEGKVIRKGKRVIIEMKNGMIQKELNPSNIRRIVKSELPADKPPQRKTTAKKSKPTHIRRVASIILASRPEPIVFILMRRLAATRAGMASFELRRQIKRWRNATHDRLRKIDAKWIAPKELRRRRNAFVHDLDEAEKIAKEARKIRGDSTADRNRRMRLEMQAYRKMLAAAQRWPDPLVRTFLIGVANYNGKYYHKAEPAFRKCRKNTPLVAAFHQGHALALLKVNRPLDSLEAIVEVLQLQPDSKEALKLLRNGIKSVPSSMTRKKIFVRAQKLAAQYDDSSRRTRTRRKKSVRWMLPGKFKRPRGDSLPRLSYFRMTFNQATAVPVGKHTLLVDSAIVKNAGKTVYVRIDADTTVPAKITRRSSRKKTAPPLTLLTVNDYEFKPLKFDADVKFTDGQKAAIYALGFYTEMDQAITRIETKVKNVSSANEPLFSAALSAGDAGGPVVSPDRQLLGFLAGKIDVRVAGGGKDIFIAPADLADLLKRIKKKRPSRSRSRRTVTVKPATGDAFIVYSIECEKLN